MSEDNGPQPAAQAAPGWRPLRPIDRRVLGVLAEKAKTTPDIYPMSLNAITTACNQKSNRAPLMQLEPDDVQESLDRLRELGAVGMVEGYGRVTKFRHYLYEWLGCDKLELSVMIELLLRGAQTEGDLRGRASRMDPIADLAALRVILAALRSKALVLSLTAEGRGHVVSHALYPPQELEHLKAQFQQRVVAGGVSDELGAGVGPPSATTAPPPPAAPRGASPHGAESLGRQVEELRTQLAQLQSRLDDMTDQQERMTEELRQLKDALGG
ncbi:MAG: DUF480 domain-containing protein [Thermoguttaceae bacterium]|jgi:uncharacterized protein YceH (UPF0502 family)